MFQCPQCRATFNSAQFSGWVLKVSGSITIDDDGRITSVSPMRAITTIKQGHELQAYKARLQCPSCSFQADPSKFPILRLCKFTSKVADVCIPSPVGDMWIHSAARELIEQLIGLGWKNDAI